VGGWSLAGFALGLAVMYFTGLFVTIQPSLRSIKLLQFRRREQV